MDFSKLSYGEIQGKANELSNSAKRMEDLLNEIKALFGRVGNDDVWSGTAAGQTKETFDKLSAKFPEFIIAVEKCSRYLNSVVDQYKQVDRMATGQDTV